MSRLEEQAALGDAAVARADVAIVGAGYVGLPLAQTFADARSHVDEDDDFRNATGRAGVGNGKVWKL